jgi:hypothetical protein
MKRVIASRKWLETEPTLVRRWQTKWKLQGESLLVSARASLAAESAKHRRTAVTGFSAQELSRLSNLARGIEPSAWALLTREMKNSPWAKLSKKLNESPWAKLTREAQASPWERLAREHFSAAQNFHDMQRKINDAIDPPYLRELRRIGKS